jgi:hypothetical protein
MRKGRTGFAIPLSLKLSVSFYEKDGIVVDVAVVLFFNSSSLT